MKAAAPPPALPPLYGAERWLATLSVSLATFMNVLDSSIANVSIPAISGDLGVSPAQGTWVITSFAVANAISMPLTGWLAMRFGVVRVFIASTLLFVVASLHSSRLALDFRLTLLAKKMPMLFSRCLVLSHITDANDWKKSSHLRSYFYFKTIR